MEAGGGRRRARSMLFLALVLMAMAVAKTVSGGDDVGAGGEEGDHDHEQFLKLWTGGRGGDDDGEDHLSWDDDDDDEEEEEAEEVTASAWAAKCRPPMGKNVVNVDSFGAAGDGCSDDTEAFLNAWKKACSLNNAVFLVPGGRRYKVGAARFMGPCKSRLIVQIQGTIVAPEEPSEWDAASQRLWLLFSGLAGARIQGGGVVDGSGAKWWANSCKIDRSKPCKGAPTGGAGAEPAAAERAADAPDGVALPRRASRRRAGGLAGGQPQHGRHPRRRLHRRYHPGVPHRHRRRLHLHLQRQLRRPHEGHRLRPRPRHQHRQPRPGRLVRRRRGRLPRRRASPPRPERRAHQDLAGRRRLRPRRAVRRRPRRRRRPPHRHRPVLLRLPEPLPQPHLQRARQQRHVQEHHRHGEARRGDPAGVQRRRALRRHRAQRHQPAARGRRRGADRLQLRHGVRRRPRPPRRRLPQDQPLWRRVAGRPPRRRRGQGEAGRRAAGPAHRAVKLK
ncbi:peptide chain release factor 2 isoform X2 [Oryza brachyantha]|uniref:peptide chain release factor 2 isoform X2 n=1 Tax=Oryza brachyantha TaxID=4533 RepID=UPI001ADAEEE6|nr:peptide chain release factor 2 isoform X2 [Oryza brachyantha]